MKSKRILSTVGVAILSLVLVYIYRNVFSLLKVNDAWEFTKSYDTTGKSYSEKLGKDVTFIEGRELLSPIIPYSKLVGLWVESVDCPRRYINVDTLWKVFWVEIAECGQHTKFYGPYRFNDNVERIKKIQDKELQQKLKSI